MDKVEELYDRAITIKGTQYQQELMIEECAELIQALQKHRRYGTPETWQDVVDEIGDVQITLSITTKIFGKEGVSKRMEYKHQKMEEYLDEVVNEWKE